MTEKPEAGGMRFGRTTIVAATGELIEQPVEALVYAANSRGIMGTGASGSIRLAAGPDVEREAMQQAPLELGTAVATSSGYLGERGIRTIIHAVVSRALGQPAKLESIRKATEATLRLADDERIRSLAMPLIGSRGLIHVERSTVADALVDEIVAHLRRSSSRLERIVLVLRADDDATAIDAALARARERLWVRPA
jgi:O-acetyl-ADP-ribose deacetylase (regulator of RNase III)